MIELLHGAPQRHPLMLMLLMGIAFAEIAWLAWRRRGGYSWLDSGTSMAIAVGNLLIRPLNLLLLAPLFAWVYAHRLFDPQLQGPWAFLGVVLLVDFIYYVFHRSSHMLRWMWATHGVHHSSTELNLSAAYRLGWTELLSGTWLFLLLPVGFGISPTWVTAAFALNLLYQFVLHSRLVGRLGPLEWVFNTPTHHRVHHAMNEELLDRNFGGILIVWDRLFGTFAAAPDESALRYGIAGRAPRYNPFAVAFGEWRAMFAELRDAQGLKARLRVLTG
ncbi:sterol desaturase family protein [Solimonas marina]|uniref:Sterol desaturase family protein n=1 Tax=Solimonas marina TaxID=2714601 RepID=A0A969WEL0_9GAMM|nr:sterol desaturase family protein [Solimonas marina]NKF24603.1 sterol desaturase family protein [Solimonas marina]